MSHMLLSEKYVKWSMGRKELVSLHCRRKQDKEVQGRQKPVSCPELPLAQSLPPPGFTHARRLDMRRPVEPILIRCYSLGLARFRLLHLQIIVLPYLH